MKKLFLLLSLFAFFLSSNAQDCNNEVLDDDELNTDCGGEFCPTCLPLLYEINCDWQVGQFEFQIQLPTYLWDTAFLAEQFLYVFEGDFNIECYNLYECLGFLQIIVDDIIDLKLKLYQLDNLEIVAQGQIKSQPYCPFGGQIENECPPETNFNVSATSVWADSTVYMIKLEMEGGTPPYKIKDNDAELYYHFQWENDLYYLGIIPDSVELDVSVIDFNGCRFDFPNLQRPELDFGEVEDTMSSIEKIILSNSLSIYPTIFDNQIMLDFNQNKPAKLTVYSIEGQQVAQWEVKNQKGIFSTAHLAKGTYVFALETEDEILTKIAFKE